MPLWLGADLYSLLCLSHVFCSGLVTERVHWTLPLWETSLRILGSFYVDDVSELWLACVQVHKCMCLFIFTWCFTSGLEVCNSLYKHYLYLHSEVSIQDVLLSIFIFIYAIDKGRTVCVNVPDVEHFIKSLVRERIKGFPSSSSTVLLRTLLVKNTQ